MTRFAALAAGDKIDPRFLPVDLAHRHRQFPTLAAIGDSLTSVNSELAGVRIARRDSWIDVGNLLAGSPWDFIGASAAGGLQIEAAAGSYTDAVIARAPEFCTVLLGQNNLDGDVTTAERNALNGIYEELLAAGITPILCTIFPTANDPILFRFNDWVRDRADALGVPLFDAFTALVDPATSIYRVGTSSDGTHLNPGGAAELAEAFAEWSTGFLAGRAGAAGRLVTFVNDYRPNGGAGLLRSHSGGYPTFWSGITAGDASVSATLLGNRFRAEKTAVDTRFQVNTNEIPVVGPGSYRFSARIGAEVVAEGGSWAIELLDVTNGYAQLAGWENIPLDVPVDTPMSLRFTTAGNTAAILPVLKVMGGPDSFSENGGVGAAFSITQVTVEEGN